MGHPLEPPAPFWEAWLLRICARGSPGWFRAQPLVLGLPATGCKSCWGGKLLRQAARRGEPGRVPGRR